MATGMPRGALWLPLLAREEEGLGADGVSLSEGQREQLVIYLDELVHWSARTDLTAARTPEELVDLTLADAAVIVAGTREVLGEDVGSFVDVGTGAGAPGLVVGILSPAWRGDLLEPRQRRVAFLRSVVGRLSLDLRVERARSDQFTRADWDVAMARATLPPPAWLREGARLARMGVWVLLARDEPPVLEGWRALHDRSYRWPLTGAPRRAVCYTPE